MQAHIYLNYSDDDLADVANAGLVRRAKKAVDTVSADSLESELLAFTVEGHQVKLPSTGITHAACDCGALATCKHILAAVLWLQAQPQSHTQAQTQETQPQTQEIQPQSETKAQAQPSTTTSQKNHPPTQAVQTIHAQAPADPIADILALAPSALLKSTPKAARALAYQLLQSWLGDGGCVMAVDGAKLSFDIAALSTQVRYFSGAGLAGMLSDLPAKQQPAVHLACLAYVFASHGDDALQARWQWGADVVTVAAPDDRLSGDDVALIDALMALCLSFIRQGLSHIATSSVTALHLLNMQARTQHLPRLAGELRSLHGAFTRHLAGDVAVDEQALFVRLSRFYAYLVALKHADIDKLPSLKGRVRAPYQAGEQLALIPLGVEWWQTEGGARGLSFCAWETGAGVMHTVTNARANALDTTFDRGSAARTGIWGAPIDKLLTHQLTLTQIKLSDTGKLSAGQDTRYVLDEALANVPLAAFKRLVPAVDDWQALLAQLRPKSLIDDTAMRHVFVYVSDVGEMTLNELAQRFECLLYDKAGMPLTVSLPVSARSKQKNLEYWQRTGGICGLLLSVRQAGDESLLVPCSLLIDLSQSSHSKLPQKGVMIVSLDYDSVPQMRKKSLSELMAGRIARLLNEKKAPPETPPSPLVQMLSQSQSVLDFYASTGRRALDGDDVATLSQIADHCQALGLFYYGDALNALIKSDELPAQLLRTRLLLHGMQAQMVWVG